MGNLNIQYRAVKYLNLLIISSIILLGTITVSAQTQPGAPLGLPGENPEDTTGFNSESNTDEWGTVNLRMYYKYLNSDKIYHADTSIHTFHRKPFSQPWHMNLGNFGSASRNLMFTPLPRFGPTLGYHAFDVYRIDTDSLKYYNTNAPYSVFGYALGSKLEQNAYILHTQNIKPNWNIAASYNKLMSQGYFLLQRTNHDHGMFSTNYESVNRRYKLNAGFTYNKAQQDENGGIIDESQLSDPDFNERTSIDVRFGEASANAGSTIPRSLINNILRDWNVLLAHSYAWGSVDTSYNDDSTQIRFKFTRRFSVSHEFRMSNKQLTYLDKVPDSLRYANFFTNSFAGSEPDSVFSRQKLNIVDNRMLLNGFLGKREKPLLFSAGAGFRGDRYSIRPGRQATFKTYLHTYVLGRLQKEALRPGEWFYGADAQFFVVGIAAGNSMLKVNAGKDLNNDLGVIEAEVKQTINNAPYTYEKYINTYDTILNNFNKESITQVSGRFSSDKLNLTAGVRSYLISNYLYINNLQLPDQYATAFNVTQVWLQKMFKLGPLVLDNELLYQQKTGNAPVNIPQLLGRHQLSYERYVFQNALKIATGIEVRYHTPYASAGYSPIYNRFYYQDTTTVTNTPAASIFFNFKIKQFRAFVMLDQGQQYFTTNFITTPGYPAQNAMIRFGFNWVLLK